MRTAPRKFQILKLIFILLANKMKKKTISILLLVTVFSALTSTLMVQAGGKPVKIVKKHSCARARNDVYIISEEYGDP
jgi:hypothetical protein